MSFVLVAAVICFVQYCSSGGGVSGVVECRNVVAACFSARVVLPRLLEMLSGNLGHVASDAVVVLVAFDRLLSS